LLYSNRHPSNASTYACLGGVIATDLLPTPASKRTFKAADYAALWVTLVISITTYYLAASLVDMGKSTTHAHSGCHTHREQF